MYVESFTKELKKLGIEPSLISKFEIKGKELVLYVENTQIKTKDPRLVELAKISYENNNNGILQKKHQIVTEILHRINEYQKEKGVVIWHNVEDLYELVWSTPLSRLEKLRRKIYDELTQIPDVDYVSIAKPRYTFNIQKDENGIVIGCNFEIDMPIYEKTLDMIPPSRLEDMARGIPLGTLYIEPIPLKEEDIKQEIEEIEREKLEETVEGS